MSEDRKEEQRERYRRQQRHLVGYEEQKRRKAEKRGRAASRDRPRSDDDQDFEKIPRRGHGTSHDAAMRPPPAIPNRAQLEGTVCWLGKGRVRILTAVGEHVATLSPELAAAQRTAVAIGDRVLVHEIDDEHRRVVGVLPRRSELARTDDEHERRHVLAANVDLVVLVLGAERLRVGLIDRLAIALQDSGSRLLVCVNKCDLPHDREALDRELAPHRDRFPTLVVSATRGDGIPDLRAAVTGLTAAFVGHSGVGKSTLLNCLDPSGRRDVGDVRERDGRGRHTTTASSLVRLTDGTQLVDTPGVRMFGIAAGANWAAAAFPELVALAVDCRFRDCVHRHEPGCAVRAALDAGQLAPARYAAYLRLLAP